MVPAPSFQRIPLLLAALILPTALHAQPTRFVRVNQLGYLPAAVKGAVL